MQNLNVNISDREVFEYLMRVAVDDKDVNQQLTQILSSEKVKRNDLIEVLLKHTKLQNAPAGLRKVFTYFQDELFAKEILQYLKKN
jgi:hypothetical protein